MTFDTFVVGPGNRLASAAARRAADSPAASYNPLFLYSASGLGKSHILSAMAHHSERLNPDSHVLYQTLEGYLDELADAIQKGTQEDLKDRYRDLDILLLDDVQFLTGQPEAQEMLLRTLDSLNLSGSQIVLASDRPPAEIDGLDARLLSRFSGGLMVDIAPPELETRVAIIRKKCESRDAELAPGVAEQIARLPFRNVRELMGGLNRVLAAQELEGRAISPEDVAKLVDIPAERPRRVRRADRLAPQVSPEFYEAPEEAWQKQIREAAEEAEAEGFASARLRRVLDGDMEPADPDRVVADFNAVLDELRQVRSDLDVVGNPWPEAARGVLLDPDRVEEARALLASARERVREFPPFPLDINLDQLESRYPPLAVRAARQLISEEPPEYNPLFVWSPDGHGARMLLEAAGAACLAERPETRVAFISAKEFADEFIDALSEGVAGAWRERWWTVELLLIHGCQQLSETERAQDEFFHLFEAVKRRGARVMLGADRSPSSIENIDDRLRSRFEGGLVVHAEVQGVPPTPVEELLAKQRKASAETLATDLSELDKGGEVGPDLKVRGEQSPSAEESSDPDFDRSLDGLDGGSEQAAWAVAASSVVGPRPLTQLKVQPDEFPTLLSEQAKERQRAGVEDNTESSLGTSGEEAAPESAVDSAAGEAAVPRGAVHPGSSSEPIDEAAGEPETPDTSQAPEAVDVENAPIVTAADLSVPGTTPVDTPGPSAGAPASPTSTEDSATSGRWVEESLPAVLEGDIDSAIEALFTAHESPGQSAPGASGPHAEPEEPSTPAASAEPPVTPAAEPEPVATGPAVAAEPEPGATAPAVASAPAVSATEPPATPVDGPTETMPGAPEPMEDASHLDDEAARVVTGSNGEASTPPDFGFDSSGDSGVATRTRTRRSQLTATATEVDAPSPSSPMIDAVPESAQSKPKAAPAKAWVPSREETVWDWPSLEARIVVDD